MQKDDLVKLIIWTMKHYGSDAGESAKPGSKLKSQAEYIANVLDEYNQASMCISGFHHVKIKLIGFD